MKPDTLLRAAIALLLAACSLAPARAQNPADAAEARNWFQLGAMASRWSIQTGGAFVDPVVPYGVERDLGVERNGVSTQLAYGRRIGERWRVMIDIERGVRRGDTVLARDIDSGYTRFLAGTRLESRMSMQTLQVVGGWAALNRPDLELGVLFGGQWLRAQRELRGTGRDLAAFGGGSTGARSEVVDDVEPSQLLGVFTSVQLGPSAWISARALAARGGTWSSRAQAFWRLDRNFAVGLGYGRTRLSVDSQTCLLVCDRAFLDGSVQGPSATLQLSF